MAGARSRGGGGGSSRAMARRAAIFNGRQNSERLQSVVKLTVVESAASIAIQRRSLIIEIADRSRVAANETAAAPKSWRVTIRCEPPNAEDKTQDTRCTEGARSRVARDSHSRCKATIFVNAAAAHFCFRRRSHFAFCAHRGNALHVPIARLHRERLLTKCTQILLSEKKITFCQQRQKSRAFRLLSGTRRLLPARAACRRHAHFRLRHLDGVVYSGNCKIFRAKIDVRALVYRR